MLNQPSRIRALRPTLAAAVLLLLGGVLLVPAGARADSAPKTSRPVIAGIAQEGRTLTATAIWTGDPEPTVLWEWGRCAGARGPCRLIAGATSSSYTVTAADVGFVLGVRITVMNSEGSDTARSAPTAVVTAAAPPPPPPPPDPTPEPPPEPSPSPAPSPTPSPPAVPAPVPADAPTTLLPGSDPATEQPPAARSAKPAPLTTRLLWPFPVVRIRGLIMPAGANVTLLTVRAPRGVTIFVRCRGRGCPVIPLRPAVARRLRELERFLLAGTRIDIKITKPGRIGKWTTILIRRGAPPKRWDRCAYPTSRSPIRCPAG